MNSHASASKPKRGDEKRDRCRPSTTNTLKKPLCQGAAQRRPSCGAQARLANESPNDRRRALPEPTIAAQRVDPDSLPHHFHGDRGPCGIPCAVDDETECAEDVHPLIGLRVRLNL